VGNPEKDYFRLPGNWEDVVRIGNSGQASVYCPGLNKLLKQTPQTTGTNRNWNKQREFPMAIQIVMDRTGDTRHEFDGGDRAAIEKAEKRFNELTGAGFTAAVRSGPGEQRVIRSFDPTAEETLFYPRLVGG
jgi:hypothetical protein